MQFKNPELLYALFLLLIPIIVHLFQLRKFQKEYFTNVAILKKVQLQTRKSQLIKKWLVLLTRLLLLTAIIIAFTQPYFSKTNSFNTEKETVIYLDNSFSMQAKGNNGPLLKRAIQDIITSIDENEKFSLITNTDSYRNTTIKAIKNELLQLEYSSNQLSYDAALLKAKKLFSNKANSIKNLIFVSDFQQKTQEFSIEKDSSITLSAIQLNLVSKTNAFIDSLYISKQNATNYELTALLKSNQTTTINLPVSLYNNDQLVSKVSVEIKDENKAIFTIPNNQTTKGKITIDEAQLQFDNTLYFSINTPSKINVLAVSNDDANYLNGIFTEDEFNFTKKTPNTLDYALFDTQNLVILNEIENLPNTLITALKVFTDKGGVVAFIPNIKGNLSDYNRFLQQFNFSVFNSILEQEKRITSINYAHPIYANGVFEKRIDNFQYPKVNLYFPQNTSQSTAILQFEDNKPFLSQRNNVFVFSAAINEDNSNFKNINLIVPTFYNIAKQSLNTAQLYYTIGQNNQFDVSVNLKPDTVLTLVNNDESLIPEQQYYNNKVVIKTNDLPENAGVYEVKNKNEILEYVSFNYNRNESDLTYQNLENIEGINVSNSVKEAFNTIKNDTKVNELWKWFVILALVFLIIEMLILKYFK
ncbi:BatA and WFA domain-containing protein [Mesoflavibacter sp. CH_XMU1404-2]|uniref:vWA domain-containing protein n=1 Tax=Mesoflavibacter sp. CH_XMU1404-2 TaxID=3107766 RepID=UPI00300B9029